MLLLRKLFAPLIAFAVVLTLLTSPVAVSTPEVTVTGTNTFTLLDAFFMGQGIATDGEYYYTSGAITALKMNGLAKFTFDGMEPVKYNFSAIPDDMVKSGYDHIGGISCCNGRIYASVEGEPDDRYVASIVVFDAQTLEPTGERITLPYEAYDDGVPWCAVDGQTGLLYASKWSGARVICVYDTASSMELVREITLSEPIDRIQGGDFHNGVLYLSSDCKDNGFIKRVLAVDVSSGAVSVAFERNVGGETEAEGLTVWPAEDGSLFHILDYNKAVSVFVRHYKVEL